MVAMVSPRRHKAFLLSAGSVSPRLLPGLSLLLVYFYRAFSSLAFFIVSLSTPQHHPDPGKVETATGSGSYLEHSYPIVFGIAMCHIVIICILNRILSGKHI